jgi:hypothetical protein
MSYETMALEGYYVKSGVPESEAHLIASQFGQFFVRLQAKKRQEGHGNKSKALAALEVADYIFFYASVREEHELWANIRSKKDIESLIKVVRASGVCSACVSAYALEKNVSAEILSTYKEFLELASKRMSLLDDTLVIEMTLSDFTKDIDFCIAQSLAFGKRKGLWTKFFG